MVNFRNNNLETQIEQKNPGIFVDYLICSSPRESQWSSLIKLIFGYFDVASAVAWVLKGIKPCTIRHIYVLDSGIYLLYSAVADLPRLFKI